MIMKKSKFFYGKHYEYLNYLWDGVCEDAGTFIKEKLDDTIKDATFLFEKVIGKIRYGAFLYEENYYFIFGFLCFLY